MTRIVIVNPNTNAATTEQMVDLAARATPEVAFAGVTAEAGPALIVEGTALAAAAPVVERIVLGLAREVPPPAGIVVGAIGDPGVAALRGRLSIPVRGLGGASLEAARRLGVPFAIVTTTPGLAAPLRALVDAHGLGDRFAGFSFTQGDPVELGRNADLLAEKLARACEKAGASGARAVIIGGGPLSAAADRLRAQIGLPIVVPLLAAIAELREAISGQAAGR